MHVVAHHGRVHDATVVDRSDVDRSRTERWPSSRGWLSRQYDCCVASTPCHQFDELPTLTVKNGLAQFQALGATFAGVGSGTGTTVGYAPIRSICYVDGLRACTSGSKGYVTPQGQLTLHSGYGVTVTGQGQPVDVDENFDGIIDYQTHVLRAKVSSVNCTYDVAWQRVT
jgi:hypothetical protein